MSLNFTVVTWNHVVCVTDRRLTLPDGTIITEASTKLTSFDLQNGVRGFITYNGIGSDAHGVTPSDWLFEVPLGPGMSLHQFAHAIKDYADPRISKLAPNFGGNPRHTFVIGAFEGALPVVAMVSNYEKLAGEISATARPELGVEMMAPKTLEAHGAAVVTGARTNSTDGQRIKAAIARRAPADEFVSIGTKLVRDVAYRGNRRTTVGTSVLAGVLPQFGGATSISSVVGGTTIMEAANFISPSMKMAGFHAGAPTKRHLDMEAGKPTVPIPTNMRGITESPCPGCGSPVPEGYRVCGVCDRPAA